MSIDRDGEGPSLRRQGSGPEKTPGPDAGDGLRAQPFTDDVFDDDYYSRRGRTGGGRSFGLVVGIIFGIAIAAGAGWYLIEGQGGMGFSSSGEPVEVKADPSPYKMKPENPGGMQVAGQDMMVYERVGRTDTQPKVENLLPMAETPKAPPPKPQAEAEAEPPQEEPKPVAAAPIAKMETPPPAEAPKVEDAPKPAETVKAETPAPVAQTAPAPAPATEPAAPEVDPLAQAVAAAAPGRVSATGTSPTASATQPMTALVPEPAPSAPATTPSAPQQASSLPVAGAFQVQLAAARSEEAAEAEWARLSARHKDLLGALTHNTLRADLGERGVFFRLRAGPVASQAEADQLCTALSAQNVPCLVIKP